MSPWIPLAVAILLFVAGLALVIVAEALAPPRPSLARWGDRLLGAGIGALLALAAAAGAPAAPDSEPLAELPEGDSAEG